MFRRLLAEIPARALVRGATVLLGFMVLVAVGGTAAAASGLSPAASSTGSSPSGSTAPSGGNTRPDHDGHGHHYRPDHDGKDGSDGNDGKPGKDGKDGRNGKDGKSTTHTVYVNTYITRYLNSGGNTAQVHSRSQVAIYPSGGVDTGRA